MVTRARHKTFVQSKESHEKWMQKFINSSQPDLSIIFSVERSDRVMAGHKFEEIYSKDQVPEVLQTWRSAHLRHSHQGINITVTFLRNQ